MAINYSIAVANSRLAVSRDAIDGGPAAGTLKIFTAAEATLLATLTLSDPSGTIAAKVLTFSGMPKSTTAVATGTAATARFEDSTAVVVANGLTVGTSGTDVIIDNVSINSGQTVNLTAATITHP